MGNRIQWLPLEEFERLTPEEKNAYLLKLARDIETETSESDQQKATEEA